MNEWLIEPEERVRRLSQKADEVEIDPKITLNRYFNTGKQMMRVANVYLKEGDLKSAYFLQMRYISLFVEKIRLHPQYEYYSKSDKQFCHQSLKKVIELTDNTKGRLLNQFKEEYAGAKLKADQLEVLSSESLSAKKSAVSSRTDQPSLHVEVPICFNDVQYPDIEGITADDEDLKENIIPEKYPNSKTLTSSSNISYQTPEVDRSLKPSQSPLLTSIFDANFEKRQIILPSRLIDRFLEYSKPNTDRDIETCAILAGKIECNRLTITHMIFPKQTGTANSCSAENEEEIFNYQDKHDLITLGWIHTHPSQTAFLSSIDVHTHFSYQIMMPEAIAIVCAPTDKNRCFSLTEIGLKVISKCQRDGFHSHGPDILYVDMADGSNRWCFERSAYQHVAFDRIDWTAMTQQRIKMKETHTIHHQSNKFAISSINEEAPMDLDNDSHRDYNSNWNITQPMSSVPFYPESRKNSKGLNMLSLHFNDVQCPDIEVITISDDEESTYPSKYPNSTPSSNVSHQKPLQIIKKCSVSVERVDLEHLKKKIIRNMASSSSATTSSKKNSKELKMLSLHVNDVQFPVIEVITISDHEENIDPAKHPNSKPLSNNLTVVDSSLRLSQSTLGRSSVLDDNVKKRPILLPTHSISLFLKYSKRNTDRDIETCAFLAGKIECNKLTITHMIFPKQTGTANSCSAENEEEIFNYQDKRDLKTLGWIHTHPSQKTFLSSVDLHTQFPYQKTLSEAIAIVCAPTDKNRCFSLTERGLKVISKCQRDGFHSHGPGILYVDARHVVVHDGLNLSVVDLRNAKRKQITFQKMAHGSNRWCFDQSAYQHVSFDRIDWAAMAQQWIKMKETQAIHHQSNKFAISSINEEAPMDLDNDSHRDYNSNWNITQPMSSVPFYPESRNCQPIGPPPPMNYFITPPPPPPPPIQQPNVIERNERVNRSYQYENKPSSYANISSNVTMCTNVTQKKPKPLIPQRPSCEINASNRKKLPAWIREGLESMEKYKQPQDDGLTDYAYYSNNDYLKHGSDTVTVSNQSHHIDNRVDTETYTPSTSHQINETEEISPNQTNLIRKQMTDILLRVFTDEVKRLSSIAFSKYRKTSKNASEELNLKKGNKSFSEQKGVNDRKLEGTSDNYDYRNNAIKSNKLHESEKKDTKNGNDERKFSKRRSRRSRTRSRSYSPSKSSVSSLDSSYLRSTNHSYKRKRTRSRSRSDSRRNSRSRSRYPTSYAKCTKSKSRSRSRSRSKSRHRNHRDRDSRSNSVSSNRSESYSKSDKSYTRKYYHRNRNESLSYSRKRSTS